MNKIKIEKDEFEKKFEFLNTQIDSFKNYNLRKNSGT